jgi:hypothetical protein
MSYDPNDEDMKYLAVDRKKLLKEQTQTFDGKKNCWVPDKKEGFLPAEIQSTKGEEITVKITTNSEVRHGFCRLLIIIIIYLLKLLTKPDFQKKREFFKNSK